jgi:hypothetical protein
METGICMGKGVHSFYQWVGHRSWFELLDDGHNDYTISRHSLRHLLQMNHMTYCT